MARRSAKIRLLTAKETLILEMLAEGEQYGLQLVTASRRRLKRGTVYVTLGRMEDKGYVVSRLEDAPAEAGGLPRRLYRPTPLGMRVLAACAQMTGRLLEAFAK
jgi:PadR family transcriptional regulator, regulatory protein PadR